MTISLTINDIPDYLKESELYENIESDNSFDIPEELFKKELIINTFDDLVSYIKIFDYWIINNTPNKIYKFIIDNKDKINMDLLNDLFHMNDLINEIKIIINTPDNILCTYFSSIGNVKLLKYFHENGCFWDEYTCSEAAKNGHLECLKYSHENGCQWSYNTCSEAAKNGHLECLKYAHENGCKWLWTTCFEAAKNGHLECLKYAHENGCEWFSNVYLEAAKNGHLECLKYAHENGCVWYKDTCSVAAKMDI